MQFFVFFEFDQVLERSLPRYGIVVMIVQRFFNFRTIFDDFDEDKTREAPPPGGVVSHDFTTFTILLPLKNIFCTCYLNCPTIETKRPLPAASVVLGTFLIR